MLRDKIKNILFDADDTLWENNIYYVKASNDFFDLAEKAGIERDKVEDAFDQIEIQVVKERGYGSYNFVYILEKLYEEFHNTNGNTINKEKFSFIVDRFSKHPKSRPILFPKVKETLNQLGKNYNLYILTKGDYQEQEGKILRSGLHNYVRRYFILPEKNDQAYQDLLKKNNWKAAETCMVGNSPKSDINPALRNGLYAVFIPYKDTWKLDHETIDHANGRFYKINNFAGLTSLF